MGPELAGTFRRALAEMKKSPLPVTEGAATEVGGVKVAVLGGPEARP